MGHELWWFTVFVKGLFAGIPRGTGNNVQFLSDPTGNRRWLPFEIESIESPRDRPFD